MHGFYSRAELEQIANQVLGERLPGRPKQAPYVQDVVQNYKIGSRLRTPDGLVWHYCRCGTHGIALGYETRGACSLVIPQTRDVVADNFLVEGLTPAGSYQVVINDENEAHGVDYWANGKVEFWEEQAATLGTQHRMIKSSTASDGAHVTLTLYYPLTYALGDNEAMEICRSIYADVEQTDLSADPTFESIACVPMMSPVTAGRYFWGLTWGMCTIAATNENEIGFVGGHRQVTFNPSDGSIRDFVAGEQIAGYVIPSTTGPKAQTIIMLQLDP